MSFYKKSFDFNGKMINNKNFYIFKTTSSDDSSEIISKLERYETADEFFKFYINKDIKSIFKLYEEIDSIYSNLYSEINSKNINSKIDIYISNLSKLFLLSNLVSKNRIILDKVIYKTKKLMEKFFSDNNISKNIQKKLNNYVLNLLGMQNKKSKKKNYPLLLLRDNYNKFNTFKIEKPNICILNDKGHNLSTEIKIIEHSINNSSNHEMTHDITNNTYNNKSINNTNNNSKIHEDDSNIIIEELKTPKFPYKEDTLFQQIIYDNLNENDTIKESLNTIGNENNEDVNKNMSKKESIHSLYTLASKSKFNNQEEIVKGTNSKFRNLILDEKNIGNNSNNTNNNNKSRFNTKRNSSTFMLTDYKVNNIEKKDIEENKKNQKRGL